MNIKQKNLFLLWFVILPVVSCNERNENQIETDFYLSTKDKILSPSKTKSINIIENGLSKDDAITQIIVNFGYPDFKGGGVIFAANGLDLDIDVIWLHDNDLIIKYPDTVDIIKKDSSIQFLNDFVNIYYEPKKLSDSLKSKLLEYDRIGIMDTISAVLRGQIIDCNLNKPICNKMISISSGLIMYSDTTDFEGFFEFNMIPASSYRLRIKHKGYLDFIMDTLILNSGEIKSIKIGMISDSEQGEINE